MFVIILVMLFIVCALAFAYKRSKVRVQRNVTNNAVTTEPPPAYKPEDETGSSTYPQPPIFTISNANSLPLTQTNAGNKDSMELPPTYEEAIVISQNVNVNVVSRRE